MMFRSVAARVVALMLTAAVLGAPSVQATDGCSYKPKESEFITKFNNRRENNGRSRLPKDLSVTRVARHHSGKMKAQGGDPFHSGTNGTHSVAAHLTNVESFGEIVGKGATVDSLVTAFMNSSEHRSIIIGSEWTHIGVGVETTSSGTIYVTGLFVRSNGNPGTTFHAC